MTSGQPGAATPLAPTSVTASTLPPGVAIIDVREDDEWAAGHVEGSRHLPMSALPARVGELPAGDLVVVCRSGHRSGQVAGWLASQGRSAANLTGGLQGWADQGRPLVTDDGRPGRAV